MGPTQLTEIDQQFHGTSPESLSRAGSASRHPRLIDWIVCLLLVLVSAGLGVLHVPAHKTVSPIDEYVYIDYLAKVPKELFVHEGEQTGEFARHYLACHGVRTLGYYPDSLCRHTSSSSDSKFPNSGYTSADLYTPLYFGATWLMAQPLQFIGVHDLVTAGRFAGVTWLAAAAVLLYLGLRRWHIPWHVAGGASLLIVGSLPAYWSNTYISTDATALFAGSLMFFGVTLLREGSRAVHWLFILFAVVVSLLKLQNLLAVGVAALYLLANALVRAEGTTLGNRARSFFRDRTVFVAVAAAVFGVLAQGLWVVIRAASAVGKFPDQGVAVPFGKIAAVREVLKFFPGVSSGAIDPSNLGLQGLVASSLLAWVIVAGVLGVLAMSRRGSQAEMFAGSSLVGALVAGPLLAVASIAGSGYYFALPARYGMSLMPFFLACAALLCSKKSWFGYLLPLTGFVCYVAVLALPEG